MALMVTARNSGTPVDWLVRAKHNRPLEGGYQLWARVSSSQALGELRFTMPSRQGRKAREVIQQVWAQTVVLPDGAKGQGVFAIGGVDEFASPDRAQLVGAHQAAHPVTPDTQALRLQCSA